MSISGLLKPTVRMLGEAGLGPGMCWTVVRPWPPTKACCLIIGEGLAKSLLIIHDEGAIVGDGLTDWQTLQEQEFTFSRAIA